VGVHLYNLFEPQQQICLGGDKFGMAVDSGNAQQRAK
jgi:hypothetical protein